MGISPRFFTLFGVIVFLCTFGRPTFAVQEAAQTFTLDGRLYSDTAGTTPMVDGSISLRIQILNHAETCILYEETQTVDTSASAGYFTVEVGSATGAGKRSGGDSGRTMQQIYSNTISSVGGKLVSNGAACTYIPSPGDTRYVRLQITPSYDSVPRTITTNMALNSVPSAIVAERAETLQGYAASRFLLANTNAPITLNQTHLENVFSVTNYARLEDLLDGSSSQYMPATPTSNVGFNGQRITNINAPVSATDATNKNYVDSRIGGLNLDVSGVGLGVGGGKTLIWDQAANQWVAQTPTNALSTLVAGTGLTGGTITSSGTIAVDVGTTANKIVQLTSTGVLPVLDGWNLTNLDAPVRSVVGRTGAVTLNAADIGGLGTAATKNYGTAANNLVELTNNAVLPAVDGYLLTNINATHLRSRVISTTAPTSGQVLGWNNTLLQWEPQTPTTAGITDLTGDVTANGPGSVAATISNSAITAAKINASGYAINRILITDGVNPNLVTYANCSNDQILKYGATGWLCSDGYLLTNINAVQLQARNISAAAPSDGQMLTWNHTLSQWEPRAQANSFIQGGNAFGQVATLGTTDTANLNIITGGSTRMTVTSTGNVGIGTTTPVALLDINGSAQVKQLNSRDTTLYSIYERTVSSDDSQFVLDIRRSRADATAPGLGMEGIIGLSAEAQSDGTIRNVGSIKFGWESAQTANSDRDGYISFSTTIDNTNATTGGTERMRINSAGNVGIGTTTPKSILELSVTGTNSALLLPRDTTANRPAGNLTNGMMRYNTDDNKFEFYQAGAWVNFAAGSGSGSAFTQGGNAFGQVGTLGTTDTANLNIITGGSTRMTVTSAGRVGIGTNPQATLHVGGTLLVDTLNAATATHVCIDGSNILSSCSSSIRYKENVLDLDLSLKSILKLRPVSYDWIQSKEHDVGFIAEEVEKVDQRLVTYNKQGQIQGVKYDQLVAPIVKAIQEFYKELVGVKEEVEALRADNAAKEQKIKELEDRLKQIEQTLKSK